jgi:hypothetical protein
VLNHQNLLDSINRLNDSPIDLTLSDVSFSDPQVNVGNASFNTKILLSAAKSPYINSVEFRYHRISLSELSDIELSSNDGFTSQSVIDSINTDFNVSLDPADLFDIAIPPFSQDGDVANVVVAALPNSVGWIDNTNVLLAYNLPNVDALYMFFNDALTSPEYL